MDSIKPSKYDAVKACDEVVAYEADSTNPSKYEAVNAYDEVTELPLPFKAYDAVTACDELTAYEADVALSACSAWLALNA